VERACRPGGPGITNEWTSVLRGALGLVGNERQMTCGPRSSCTFVDHPADATGTRAAATPSPASGGDGLDRAGPALDDTTNFGSGDGFTDTDVHVSLHDNESDYHFKASLHWVRRIASKLLILLFNLLRQVVRIAQLPNQLQLLFEPIHVVFLGDQDLGQQVLGPVVA